MSKTAFIFPGQGSQYIGMGKDFYKEFEESRNIYDKADRILDMDLSELCFNGEKEELSKTENTQPAILVTSIAILEAIKSQSIEAEFTAGLSLGEYTSLVYAGALNFEDALKIVVKRAKFMQEAVPIGIGSMAAILSLDKDKVSKAIEYGKRFGIVSIANYNSPSQIVITGEKNAVEKTCERALDLGAKRAVTLDVSGPFHSSMLEPAGMKLKQELDNIDFQDLNKKLLSNVDAKIVKSKTELKDKLKRQVSNSVLWQQTIENMVENGVEIFVEIGPGKTLTGFVKRIVKNIGRKDIKALNVNDIDSLNKTMEILTGGL